MRRSLLLCLLVPLCMGQPRACADEAADARALVEKAVQAHGGASALAKMQKMTRTSTGKVFLFGLELPFQDELTIDFPSKWRLKLVGGAAGPQGQTSIILNGNDAWQMSAMGVVQLPKERVAEMQDETRVLSLATVAPLLQNKDLQLGLAKSINVDNRPANGIRVNQAGKAEIQLYFDAQTNLLVKIARKAQEGGLVVDKEYVYAGHQPEQGVMVPTKYSEWTSGRKIVDVSSINYKFSDRLDDKLFEKP